MVILIAVLSDQSLLHDPPATERQTINNNNNDEGWTPERQNGTAHKLEIRISHGSTHDDIVLSY